MLVKERSQSAPVFLFHRLFPFLLGQNLLEQKGVNQGKTDLDQVKAEDGHLLIFGAVREQFSTASREDEPIHTVPPLNDVKGFLNFLSELYITKRPDDSLRSIPKNKLRSD